MFAYDEHHGKEVLQVDRMEGVAEYVQHIERVINGAKAGHKIAIMCQCKHQYYCHRGYVVSESLARRGVDVKHIVPAQTEKRTGLRPPNRQYHRKLSSARRQNHRPQQRPSSRPAEQDGYSQSKQDFLRFQSDLQDFLQSQSDFWDQKREIYLAEATKKAAESAPRTIYLTKEDEADLRRELEELEVRYHASTQELKEGNADLHHMDAGSSYRLDLVMNRKLVADRISYIQGALRNATIIEDNGPSDEVRIGSTVVIREDGTNEDEEYKIAGVAKTSEGKISHKSPIGAALLGKKKGQKVKIKTPGGAVKFKIVDVR